ncbi:MAG: hypothetical protein HKN23_19755 [Verrucomicrobiales bacterium]|nr:hypothetical protein [Verrucomicrobiales bacterium]
MMKEEPELIDAERLQRWKSPVQLASGAVVLLILYVAVFPILVLYFDNNNTWLDDAPDWFYEGFYSLVIPLEFIYENSGVYQNYIEFLDEKIYQQ